MAKSKPQTRADLEAARAASVKKFDRLREVLDEAEARVAKKKAEREALRKRAIADGDPEARAQFDRLTQEIEAAVRDGKDLRDTVADLGADLTTHDGTLRRYDIDQERAAIEATRAAWVAHRDALDGLIDALARWLAEDEVLSDELHQRASAFGLTHLRRVVDRDPILGSVVRVFDGRAVARAGLLARHYREKMSVLARKIFPSIPEDHEPPADWRPPRAGAPVRPPTAADMPANNERVAADDGAA